uniref:Flavin_Reduct domain-containing protein n=1 Tax=Mesocestoides corti TaxID=53468 RepID=A0A5K3FR59_MESCO
MFVGDGGGGGVRLITSLPSAPKIRPNTRELFIHVDEMVVGVIVAAQAGETAQGNLSRCESWLVGAGVKE